MEASVQRQNGVLQVKIGEEFYAPLSFKSFRPNAQNISEFYQAGVRLFTVLSSGITSALGVPYSHYGESWVGDHTYDFSAIDRQMDLFLENAPTGYFAPMFQLDTRPWYLESHPGLPNTFTHLSQVVHDREWREAAADYLKAAIRHCEEKYGDRIYGYFMLGGMTTEWFSHADREASHPIKEAGYRRYCKDENAKLPSKEEFDRVGSVFLDEREDNVRRARRFHADSTAELVLYFAREAQSVLQHKKLLGLYYGYLLELGGERLYNDGHLGYERVYLSPDIDMISSPSSYFYRKLEDPSAFMVTQKTLDAHNKLYFLEFDHITHVAPTMIEEKDAADVNGNAHLTAIPGADSKCKDEIESLNLMYRDFILCYANGSALWWFDMFDGWFRSAGMMDAVSKMIELYKARADKPKDSVAQIAVFAQGESMYQARKTAGLATTSLSDMRRTFAQMGAPYDLYSIADLGQCDPRRHRLCVLWNAYDISQSQMEQLRSLQAAGVTVLWMYAPDYAHGGRPKVENISRAVGMEVIETNLSHGGVCFGEEITEIAVADPYFSIASGGEVIARYQDGAVAVAKSGRSVYGAVPFLSASVLREIVKECGIFLYSEASLVYTYVNEDAIGVYNATEGEARIAVTADGHYRDCITEEVFEAKNGKLRLPWRKMRAYLLVKE